MKILVTGGTGFAGKALVARLLDEGHDVVALDCKEGHKTRELRDMGADVRLGSVTDRETVRSCLEGVDVVQHLAAAFREMNVPERRYWEVNVEGTRTCLEEARAAGIKRFVYCSTCGVHGNVKNPPTDEKHNIDPADYYQQTKYDAEPLVLDFNRRGLPAVILRPAAIYGPGDPERFYMIFKRVSQGRFLMFGNGRTFYHPLYIDSFVDALVLAMEPGRGDGGAYLIADSEYVEIEELVRRVARAMGKDVTIPHLPVWPLVIAGHVCEKTCRPLGISPPIFPRRVDWFRQNRAFDISAARRDLGYDPKVGLDEGLRQTCEWYRREGYLP